jgi:hypothetical protein
VILAAKSELVDVAFSYDVPLKEESLGVLIPSRLFLLYKYNLKGFLQQVRQAFRK